MKLRLCSIALVTALLTAGTPLSAAADSDPSVSVSVRPPGANLGYVISLIEEQSGENIVLAPQAASIQVEYLSLDHVTVSTALATIEKAYGLVETHLDAEHGGSTILTTATSAGANTTVLTIPAGGAAAVTTYAQARYGTAVTVNAPDTTHVIISGPSSAVDDVESVAKSLRGDDFGIARIGIITKPEDVLAKLKQLGLLPTDMAVEPDDSTSSIFVVGTKTARDALAAAIKKVDIPPEQLYFTVDVLDVTPQNDSSTIGVSWGQPVEDQSTGTIGINPGTSVTTFVNRVIPIGAQLNLLVQKGQARVLSRPSISLLNNDTAELQIGSNYPIVTTSTGLLNGQNVQFYKIGILLQLNAHVGSDDVATVKLTSTYSDLGAIAEGTTIPEINTRYATSSLRVKNGDVIVQAGYYRDADTTTIQKLPILGDIPILGTLFKSVAKTGQREELVFVITPHIGTLTPAQATNDKD